MPGATDHQTRQRMVSEVISGANARIAGGLWGQGSPVYDVNDVDPRSAAPGIYFYHEGDLFTPGAGNFVFEPWFELPLVTIWGNAFLRKPNTFRETQPPQVWSNHTVVQNGIGGLQAGEYEMTGLEYENLGPQEING